MTNSNIPESSLSPNIEHSESTPEVQAAEPKILSARQRRVLGTLMEKSKTTPDAYPLSFAGLTTGCNQKSNRHPTTNFSPELVEKVVDELRTIGAAVLVHGSGRVEKVKHLGYQWLGVNKAEAAVMTELLLRGEQTLGELRQRVSRMEPIEDLAELQKILHDLEQRQLVVMLTPSGRGQIVSHHLYEEWELRELKESIGTRSTSLADQDEGDSVGHGSSSAAAKPSASELSELRKTVEELKQTVEELKQTVESLANRIQFLESELGVEPPKP